LRAEDRNLVTFGARASSSTLVENPFAGPTPIFGK
jgi:hypothetical protein